MPSEMALTAVDRKQAMKLGRSSFCSIKTTAYNHSGTIGTSSQRARITAGVMGHSKTAAAPASESAELEKYWSLS